jgi:predicted TPR repeat methyltransferase
VSGDLPATGAERLAWIYAARDAAELRARYDAWAAHYDDEMEGSTWIAPQAAAGRCLAHAGTGATVLDAGCGTGQVGVALRRAGAGRIVGLDFSPGMLRQATATGAYDALLQASLTAPLPLAARSFDAVVSVGVFTYGHVPPAALAALGPLVCEGGVITLTFRDDVFRDLGFDAATTALEAGGGWTLLERGEAAPMIAEGGVGVDMRVWSWRVRHA